MKPKARNEEIEKQLRTWTVVGPLEPGPGDPAWFSHALDGAAELPSSCEHRGTAVPAKTVRIAGPRLDFWDCIGRLPGTPHAFAFCELKVPEDTTLHLAYDADWSAVWWLDGVEVAATRGGNQGPVGTMRHPILIGLRKGRHMLAVRVASGLKGWAVVIEVRRCAPGLTDLVRTDRDAAWRDYRRALVRHENRPTPDGTCGGLPKEKFEHLVANLGVDARWIGVVEAVEGSHYASPHLPLSPDAKPEYEQQLKQWVEVLHRHRIAALSWYPLCLCRPAIQPHPDWRQQYLVAPQTDDQGACCINTGYGDAVIQYVIEALQKFDLDGIWFDGSAFSPIWTAPQPVSCVCPACRAKRRNKDGGGQGAGAGGARGGATGGGGGGGGGGNRGRAGRYFSASEPSRGRREFFPATCAACGCETTVPFRPVEGRPVYCRDCFQSQKDSSPRGR